MHLFAHEQFLAAQKANLDAVFNLANKWMGEMERLTELNLNSIRSTLAATRDNALKACSAKDPQEWFALQSAFGVTTAENVQSYSRQLFEIMSAIQAEFAQTQYEAYNRRMQIFTDVAAGGVPVGSEAAIAAWQSAITATNTLIESLQKTSQQAVRVAESNFDAVATSASKTARRVADQALAGAKK